MLCWLLVAAICPAQNAAPSRSPSKANTDATAQQAFATNCAGCHGLDGKGGERAPDIVTRPNVRQLSDAQLLQILQNGIPRTSMPAFSYLGDPVLRGLLTHLRTLQGDPKTENLPGDVRRGKQLFFGQAECSRCHTARGEGGFFASDLTGYAKARGPGAIRDAILQPNRDLDLRNRIVVATLANGRTIEGIARNEDNFSMQLLTPDGFFYLLTKSALKNLSYRNESPMPADYGSRLSAAQIDDLVKFLDSLAKENLKKEKSQEDEDED
ncbi:MAG TPA: c-type cytochrome [Candidatus Acidoferrum sp.]|nr:c-type cytochrome [Candidatus Acidoferrum sp.]